MARIGGLLILVLWGLFGCGNAELRAIKKMGYEASPAGFIQALREKNGEAARLFLKANFDVNTRDEIGRSVLAYAAMMGDKELVEMLLDRGAEIDAMDRDGQTPLMAAIITKQDDIARLLVKRGAAVNPKTPGGLSPLMLACNIGRKDNPLLVDFLIEKGAEVNARDAMGRTPLMYAVGKIRKRSVEILVHAGADVNARDNEGRHVLFYLTGNGEREARDEIIAYLKAKGAKDEQSPEAKETK